ncbi:MAG: DNA alkylation repair protein [Pikeienuella sp.]
MTEIDPTAAIEAMRAVGDAEDAVAQASYHKSTREHLGLRNPVIDGFVKDWRAALDVHGRVALADGLWRSDIHEARIAAGKLLTQARIREGEAEVWALIASWVPSFDAWAISDHAASAGARRLTAAPARLDEVESWTTSENMWARRAALVFTLPWAKGRHPDEADRAHRERILGWAAGYAADHEWFIQKSIGWWLRTLSKHDPDRVSAFLVAHGDALKPFARREAGKYL